MAVSGLFADFYELTMAQGYWKHGKDNSSVFEVFSRRQPFQGGFSVFAGLEPLLGAIEEFRFAAADLDWLGSLGGFEPGFLEYLESFRFSGDIWAFDEGEIMFPQEPVLRVHANLIEAQLIEGLVLNTVNFQSLIATKAARVALAAKGGSIMEFGLRRAQGRDGALSASRAAYIGGASGSSNAEAARTFGIPAMGTMAHSWVMAFPDELSSFEAYAEMYPEKTVFLIDTYDTLGSGIHNAIAVGRKLAKSGRRFGVRLDSGDIFYLSTQVRRSLDAAGLADSYIVVSNELEENIIEHLTTDGAPVDVWGVGTSLVTGGSESSFTGVYKMAAVERDGKMVPTMKFSDNPEKSTTPGVKNLWRLFDEAGKAVADVMSLEGERIEAGVTQSFQHPSLDMRRFDYTPNGLVREMLKPVMRNGAVCRAAPALRAIKETAASSLRTFDQTYLRFLNPHVYKVSMTESLRKVKLDFFERHLESIRSQGAHPAT